MKTRSTFKALFFLGILAASSWTLGCGPDRSTYLDKKHARSFLACPSEDIEKPAQHAYEAIIASLSDNNWVIEKSSKKNLRLTARACDSGMTGTGDYLKLPVKYCLVMNFVFREDGEILAYNPDGQRFYTGMASTAAGWVQALERTYAELRCWSEDELSRRNAATARK